MYTITGLPMHSCSRSLEFEDAREVERSKIKDSAHEILKPFSDRGLR
jgi:hypothetical protein